MRIYKKAGTKERLFEMFENVNKVKLNEGVEVHYSDGIRQMEKFNNFDQAVQFSKETIANNPKLQHIAIYNDDGGFHSTAQEDKLLSWWGDGSYWDNVSKEKPELLNKKLMEESVEVPQSMIQHGASIPIAQMDDTNFPPNQALPAPTTADATIRVNPSKWKALFTQKWGEEGALEYDGTFWNVKDNPKYSEWKEGSNANKASYLNKERSAGRTTQMDSYDPTMNEDESSNVAQEIYDELDMRYSHTTKNIPFDEINDVAEMYGVQPEDVAQVAAEVIANNQEEGYQEITDDVKELIKRFQDNNVDVLKISPKSAWEVFENEYEAHSEFNEFKSIWDKFTKDPNQLNMFKEGVDNPQLGSIKFKYDQKGNYVPEGYEDKKIALRSLEQPLGSGNWKVGVVTLDDMGEFGDFIKIVDTWDEAKDVLHSSIT